MAQVLNGALLSEPPSEDRIVKSGAVTLTVFADGRKTAGFVRNGIKWPGGRKVEMLVGECDGVRCYAQERDGHVYIFLGRRNMEP